MQTGFVNYRDKLILAPMVRVTTLPIRLLALDYGADLVYCEEIIDFKILQTKRYENKVLGTVDFLLPDKTVVFRTCSKERDRVIFQLGTADAKRALSAAKVVEGDVAGLDVNMGCPKDFSLKGGMGAALLTQPEKVKEILSTLVKGLSIPVTCKIRILPRLEDTLSLVKMIAATGVAAIAIHGRTKDERSQHHNHNDIIKHAADVLTLPVIANGGSKEVKEYKDIAVFRRETGCTSVMLARVAEWNVSIFRPEGMLPLDQVIKAFLKYAIDYDSHFNSYKYIVQQMMHTQLETDIGKRFLLSATTRDICSLWGMAQYLDDVTKINEDQFKKLDECKQDGKRRKCDSGQVLIEKPVKFIRKEYPNDVSPKTILRDILKQESLPSPIYETTYNELEKLFYSIVTVSNTRYTSSFGEKCKRYSEQAAAVVYLQTMGLSDGKKDPQCVIPCNEQSKKSKRRQLQCVNSVFCADTSFSADNNTNS